MNLTVLSDGAQHPLQDVIVDDDVQETEAVEISPEGYGKDGCCYKQLCACVRACVCACVRACVCACACVRACVCCRGEEDVYSL